jgi:hypothetical protein
MKTKENLETKSPATEKKCLKTKPKSLRPMRSMVAVRSLKPKTHVAQMILKTDESASAD